MKSDIFKVLNLTVGKKTFSIRCSEDDVTKIENLTQRFDNLVSDGARRYQGLSTDNIILLTVLEMIDDLDLSKIENIKLKHDIDRYKQQINSLSSLGSGVNIESALLEKISYLESENIRLKQQMENYEIDKTELLDVKQKYKNLHSKMLNTLSVAIKRVKQINKFIIDTGIGASKIKEDNNA